MDNYPQPLSVKVRHICRMANDALLTLIDERLKALGLSERKACLNAKLNISAIQSIRKGRAPRASTLAALAPVLGVPAHKLMGLAGQGPGGLFVDDEEVFNEAAEAAKKNHRIRSGEGVPEIDVRGGMGAGGEALLEYKPDGNGDNWATDAVTGLWELPPDYLHRELRVRPGAARIIEVQGDSMEPLLHTGDRVLVNLMDRAPSPPGVFALWDGMGVIVKRLEYIMNSDPPTIIISSDNPKHRTYERTPEDVNIIGRVVWFARRL